MDHRSLQSVFLKINFCTLNIPYLQMLVPFLPNIHYKGNNLSIHLVPFIHSLFPFHDPRRYTDIPLYRYTVPPTPCLIILSFVHFVGIASRLIKSQRPVGQIDADLDLALACAKL